MGACSGISIVGVGLGVVGVTVGGTGVLVGCVVGVGVIEAVGEAVIDGVSDTSGIGVHVGVRASDGVREVHISRSAVVSSWKSAWANAARSKSTTRKVKIAIISLYLSAIERL
jgi:hypothetical protein